MKATKQLLTQEAFDRLNQSADWRKVESRLDVIRATPGIQRKADLLGVFHSGDANATKNLNGRDAVFGMDVLVYERRPNWAKGEWWVNAYHYVVTRTNDPTLPYCLEGPFPKQTLVGHWPSTLDLSVYDEPPI